MDKEREVNSLLNAIAILAGLLGGYGEKTEDTALCALAAVILAGIDNYDFPGDESDAQDGADFIELKLAEAVAGGEL